MKSEPIKYLLDTNICIYILNNKPEKVRQKMQQIGEFRCAISSIVASELAFGAQKSGRPENKIRLNQFLSLFQILPFDHDAVWHYAKLRVDLQAKGTPIGNMDELIAAHALSLDVILVTNNLKEFERVESLQIENWV